MKRNIRTEKEEKAETTQTQSKNEFWEAVAGTTSETPKAKAKDKIETLSPPQKIKELIDDVVEAKKSEKEAKAAKETAEVDVIAWASEKHAEAALGGNFQKSYRLQGVKEMVTFVTSDKFSRINPNDLPALKEAFGKKFDEMVQKKVAITILDAVMNSQELQAELMDRIGKENFSKFFKAEVEYVPTDGFDRKVFSFPKRIVEQVKELVRQAKPSLK